MIKKKISYTLLPTNNELDKRWFIKVKVFNINTLSVEYLRKYGSRLNRFRTVEARLLVYPQVLASIDEELQKNATYWGSAEEYIKSKTQSPKDPNENEIIGVHKILIFHLLAILLFYLKIAGYFLHNT